MTRNAILVADRLSVIVVGRVYRAGSFNCYLPPSSVDTGRVLHPVLTLLWSNTNTHTLSTLVPNYQRVFDLLNVIMTDYL